MVDATEKVDVEKLKSKAEKPTADAMALHPFYRGKIETALKCTRYQRFCYLVYAGRGCSVPGHCRRAGTGV